MPGKKGKAKKQAKNKSSSVVGGRSPQIRAKKTIKSVNVTQKVVIAGGTGAEVKAGAAQAEAVVFRTRMLPRRRTCPRSRPGFPDHVTQ